MEAGRIIELKYTSFTPIEKNGVMTVDMRDITYKVGKSYHRGVMAVDEITYEVIGNQVFFFVRNAATERDESGNKMKKGWKTLSNLMNMRITHDCETIINTDIEE